MSRATRRVLLTAVPLAIAIAVYGAAQDHFEAAAFVVRAADMQGLARRAANIEAMDVRERPATLPWRTGELRALVYEPARVSRRVVLLVPGVHADGIAEPRLVRFAREMAATGHRVVSVELPDLLRYEITPHTTDMIEEAGGWIAREWNDGLSPGTRPIGLMGISFGGGLAVVAASRMGDRVAWVLSFGGHGDLPRTLEYLCTGVQPDGSVRPPHDYGVVIVLLGVAERLVPAEQVQPLRQAIHTFLEASHLAMTDTGRAENVFAQARALGDGLPEPARTFMTWVNTRDVPALGRALLPHVRDLNGGAALSPERNPAPSAPVYLLHGSDDNVIPAAESDALAADLRRRGGHVVHLSTPLITHAEVDRPPGVRELWRLIRFWAGPL